ncbi:MULTISPECIES: type II toxin-antitoxin system RelE/ParE family toxin [Pseudomonas]|jgi:putative addiction module killer protein|uniref:Addiction module killer protein n=1 Tax=Pseudomonas rhodesiae TaxID=76760 RepID=A0A5C5P148_9PSED|nr:MULTISPECIES: type II toxin-antitoxin system RelE/ParE family toxin [Pseudomonas]MBB4814507.1 putative addiction module killer protein [Pseudomonas rhodesiae]MBI6600432.1 type II toxin-antitoxin system RelE/ParE family toxin [Pseudomonas sp. S4_EA_1b]MBI6625673.1 type II toxin-antitoxin system RelE/ParE family toxin [Pseudomonas rhodesiae]MBX4136865.1 type II toxin-antitoxin system RelE/ParE family toxin [Pseudomonas sp. S5F11]MDN6863479.1 type II toxin-antitoxin system RelE/ParE family tox
MTIEFNETIEFANWLEAVRDPFVKVRVVKRVRMAEAGNFGDCESVGDGVFEMRIHYGPGYRVYFTRRDEVVYLLLIGGDKSTQSRDIKRAKQIAINFGSEE